MMPHATSAGRRRGYLAGCAMALVLGTTPADRARAQAFQGAPDIRLGSAVVTVAPNVTNISVQSGEVVIDWTPFDTTGLAPIDFLPATGVATYVPGGEPPIANYTVLNRILPVDASQVPVARIVEFNGRVESYIGNTIGGSLWFYSPTGIVVGPTAVFNTGSLVLTTNDIIFDNSVFGPGGEIRFRGPAGAKSSVVIQPGARLDAVATNAYLALVAPRVEQGGTVTANGPIAYVAAEQLDMTINAGLIDLAITLGTTDDAGIIHRGTTGGAASTGPLDQQRIQMIAMPKNDALTMLLGGTIGYDPALAAVADGSAIVLSAGIDPDAPLSGQSPGLAGMRIENTTFTNRVEAFASDAIAIEPVAGTVDFRSDALLIAKKAITALAEDRETILAAATVNLVSGHEGAGGTIRLEAQPGGLIDVAGTLVADASARLTPAAAIPAGRDAFGGTVEIIAAGGRIEAGAAIVNATAEGETDAAAGGAGQGGAFVASASGGGTIASPLLTVDTSGRGGTSPGLGGAGRGGTIGVASTGGLLDLGLVTLDASGIGASGGIGGAGVGGTIGIALSSQPHDWDALLAIANGVGGLGSGVDGIGGGSSANAARLSVTGGASLAIVNNLFLESSALVSQSTAAATTGSGGTVEVRAADGGGIQVGGLLSARAGARVYLEAPGPLPSFSPTLQGGTVDILASGGSTIGAIRLEASTAASGLGAITAAGTATGGTTLVGASSGGSLVIDDTRGTAVAAIDADAFGSAGLAPASATGGSATLFADGGTVDIRGTARVSASAAAESEVANATGTGFAAQGGTAAVNLAGGGTLRFAALTLEANGNASGPGGGTVAIVGDGGDGRGGTATAALGTGAFVSAVTTVRAIGSGGNSAGSPGTAFAAGSGTGGTAALDVTGATMTPGVLQVESRGHGGGALAGAAAGEAAALAGSGQGGTARLSLAAGSLDAPSILIDAGARGGRGMEAAESGSAGGDAIGGTALVTMPAGSTAVLTTPDMIARSAGQGGDGATGAPGGAGTGGLSRFAIADGRLNLGVVMADAVGIGGTGGVGGGGRGGDAEFLLIDSGAGPGEVRRITSLSLAASGLPSVAGASIAGATVLTVQPGQASPLAVSGAFSALSEGTLAPAGNGFTGLVSGPALTIGGDATIRSSRDIALTVAPGSLFDVAGVLTIDGRRTVVTSGGVRSGGAASVIGDTGIAMTDLQSGATTMLRAINGAVSISSNLGSVGSVTVLGRSVDLVSLGALTFADADAIAGPLAIRTAGNLVLATADATGAVLLTSGGTLTATGAVQGAAIDAVAQGALNLASLTAPGAISLTSNAGPLTVTGPIQGGAITTGSFGDQTLGIVTGTGPVSLTSIAGTLDAGAVSGSTIAARAPGDLTLAAATAPGAVVLTSTAGALRTIGAVRGGAIALTAAGEVRADGSIDAAGALQVVAGGAFRLSALGTGATIAVDSRDIALGATARLGTRGRTAMVALTNIGTAQTFIGGGDNAAGYSLSAAEIGRLSADNAISLAGPGTLVVDGFAVGFGIAGNIGSGGQLALATPGTVSVVGPAAATVSGTGDRLAIDAGRIEVVADSGSIVLSDASGAPGGTLLLRAPSVVAATRAAMSDIAGLAQTDLISDRLDVPGPQSDGGYLRAGRIDVTVRDAFYVQNSGAGATFAARRGFTAGLLSIVTTSPAARIAINGMTVGSGGIAAVGLDTAPTVQINGLPALRLGAFDLLSTINGCVIGFNCQADSFPPAGSAVQSLLLPSLGEETLEFLNVFEIVDNAALGNPPLIDEPITGVGNDDLWIDTCQPEDRPCPERQGAR